MAVFRKFLSSAKSKVKAPKIKFRSDKDGASTSDCNAQSEEFERRKQEWQEELEEMSEFLYIKNTAEQKEEGASDLVDTAFIQERDGMPFLKAVFDVSLFKKEDVHLQIEDNQLVLQAQGSEDKDDRVYTRTMVRRVDLPAHVDPKMMHCDLNNGILSIEMPFHLPPTKKPQGPNVFPIMTDSEGNRKIRLLMFIGTDFTNEDVQVVTNGKSLKISAKYDEEIGKYGNQKTGREFKREYMLPEHLELDHVTNTLSPDGRLFVEIYLKDDKPFICKISTEDLSTEDIDNQGS